VTDVSVIDQFLGVFSRYIDSGFGLVRGDVVSLARILVGLDVGLAALFWAWSPGEEVLARLVKKTLYVGAFAFLISDFPALADRVFRSFAALGLKAAGSGLTAADLLRPGHIAAAGVAAVKPLLAAAGELAGFPGVFENLVQIAVLLASVLVVLVAFFVLAVQLFVTLVEFKLTTLAGFVLVPFGLFGRTAFLAERVLGAVMASGVKVLVLAVVIGIGSTLFQAFVSDLAGAQPDLETVLSLALAALTLLGLGIFCPGIASGLVSGAPQMGAGAAVGTGLAAGGLALAAGGVVRSIATSATALRGAAAHAGPSSPPGAGGPGAAGAGPRPGSPAPDPAGPSAGGADAAGPPAWARSLRATQIAAAGAGAAAQALRAGDSGGASAAVPLDQEKP
jgi:type IV secretion system protein TrbL